VKRVFATPPSPSLVISVIALCVALGGASYAAIRIPAGSVGTTQLRTGAVTGRKIARGAVTGSKIGKKAVTASKVNVTRFPTVPSATHASTADSAKTATNAVNARTATNAVNAVNSAALGGRAADAYALARTLQPTSAFLENGWSPSSGVPGYAKDQFGIVHLFGSVQSATPTAGDLFTLPVGFRPGYTVDALVRSTASVVAPNPAGLLEIEANGSVSPRNGTTFIELEGVTFAAGG